MLPSQVVVVLCHLAVIHATAKKLTKFSPIRWVAPTAQEWRDAELGDEVKTYWELEWAKSDWDESCSEERLKIVPVYFWPGDRVNLPCYMCELPFVFNGKVKRWGVAENIPDFLEDPQKFAASDQGKWKQVQNPEWFDQRQLRTTVKSDEGDKLPYSWLPTKGNDATLDEKEPPAFLQRDGRLSIIRASPAVQGVYFCYDESSLASTNLFYVVMAMVPPVSITADSAFTDGCSDKEFILPSFNWRFHFLPAIRHDRPESCLADPTSCTNLTYLQVSSWTDSAGNVCDLDHCRKDIMNIADNSAKDLNVAIELRWDEWTSCLGGVQRREAHCHLVRKEGQTIPEDTSAAFTWLGRLNRLFDLEPFKEEGIRLHSSLIPSLIQGVDKLTGCQMKNEALLENAYRETMLYTMGVRKNGTKIDRGTDYTFRLTNAFQACLGYEREGKDWELVVGTYMVEARSCVERRTS